MKLLVAVLMVIFSLQAILMPGAMAAGHMPGMSKVSSADTLEKEHPAQNHQIPFQKSALCCAVDCGCTSFLKIASPQMTAQQSGNENPFYLVHLVEPPSFVLPDPPRTIFI